jgi:hypothetical protein
MAEVAAEKLLYFVACLDLTLTAALSDQFG